MPYGKVTDTCDRPEALFPKAAEEGLIGGFEFSGNPTFASSFSVIPRGNILYQ